MRVLIVEDEAAVGKLLKTVLEAGGFTTYVTELGQDALGLLNHYTFGLIVLDISLPDMSGIQVLQRMRAGRVFTPVLAISGNGAGDRIVQALTAGADDFMAKPYRSPELVARIKAIIRRSHGFASSQMDVGEFVVDLDEQRVLVRGKELRFTRREYQIVELLSLRWGATVTREALLDQLYGGLDEPEPKILDVYICRIRRKLLSVGVDASIIATEWGRGYRIDRRTSRETGTWIATAS